MAETPSKRQREETHIDIAEDNEEPKRHKSYDHILSLLEDEEDEPNQDLSSILKTLQRELSSDSTTSDDPLTLPSSSATDAAGDSPAAGSSSETSEFSPASHGGLKERDEEEDETERFMRHLLEASDDELGIPNRVGSGDDEWINGGDGFSVCDGLWELEDEAANYYTLLQSELFM